MPNVNKIITLSSKGGNAGPYFGAYYSTDCISYTFVSDVFLPNVGSEQTISVPDTTTCIKLINLSGGCGENYVISGSINTTTTTSTTSTTTVGPTTTSTTQPVCALTLYYDPSGTPSPTGFISNTQACINVGTALNVYFAQPCPANFEYVANNSIQMFTSPTLTTPFNGRDSWYKTISGVGGSIFYVDTNGYIGAYGDCPNTTTTTTNAPTTTTTTTLAPVYYQILSCVDSSTAYSIQYPAGTYNSGDRVITNTSVTCVVIGSTTTLPGGTLYTLSSTGQFGCPTTTTIAPTTQAPQTLQVRQCGTTSPVYYAQVPYAGYVNGLAVKLFKSGTPFNGSICWEITDANSSTTPDYYDVAVNSTWSSCSDSNCTTTTTLAPTTTTTQARVNVNFFLNFDAGNDGTLEIYSASPASAGYTLDNTLTFDGASYQLSLLPGDGFYAKITQTARASAGQRGQITTIRDAITEDYVVTGAGALPQSVSSTPTTITSGTAYNVFGLCGDQV